MNTVGATNLTIPHMESGFLRIGMAGVSIFDEPTTDQRLQALRLENVRLRDEIVKATIRCREFKERSRLIAENHALQTELDGLIAEVSE